MEAARAGRSTGRRFYPPRAVVEECQLRKCLSADAWQSPDFFHKKLRDLAAFCGSFPGVFVDSRHRKLCFNGRWTRLKVGDDGTVLADPDKRIVIKCFDSLERGEGELESTDHVFAMLVRNADDEFVQAQFCWPIAHATVGDNVYVILQHTKGENVEDLVPLLEWNTLCTLVCHVAQACCVLVANGLRHNDLYCKNLSYRRDTMQLVVIDYGLVSVPERDEVHAYTADFMSCLLNMLRIWWRRDRTSGGPQARQKHQPSEEQVRDLLSCAFWPYEQQPGLAQTRMKPEKHEFVQDFTARLLRTIDSRMQDLHPFLVWKCHEKLKRVGSGRASHQEQEAEEAEEEPEPPNNRRKRETLLRQDLEKLVAANAGLGKRGVFAYLKPHPHYRNAFLNFCNLQFVWFPFKQPTMEQIKINLIRHCRQQ